jgi:hypothetical protein
MHGKDAIHAQPYVEQLAGRDLLCRLDGGTVIGMDLVKDQRGSPVIVEDPNLVMLHRARLEYPDGTGRPSP